MGFIALKCPECGASIELDDSRGFGFCSYCGTKIIQEKQIIENRIKADYTREIEGNLILAERYLREGNKNNAKNCFESVIRMDPSNVKAMEWLDIIDKIVDKPNVTISRKKKDSASANYKVFIDDKEVAVLADGESTTLIVQSGKHTIQTKCLYLKSPSIEFEIKDAFSKVEFYTQGGFSKLKLKIQ